MRSKVIYSEVVAVANGFAFNQRVRAGVLARSVLTHDEAWEKSMEYGGPPVRRSTFVSLLTHACRSSVATRGSTQERDESDESDERRGRLNSR